MKTTVSQRPIIFLVALLNACGALDDGPGRWLRPRIARQRQQPANAVTTGRQSSRRRETAGVERCAV